MIAIRFALYANLMLLFGWPLFALSGPAEVASGFAPPKRVLLGLVLSALALSLLGIAAMAASMMGVGLAEIDRASTASLIFDTSMGAAWRARMAALLLLAIHTVMVKPERSASGLAVVVAGGVSLASLAWTGHGAAGEGATGWLELLADIIHLLAAGAWVGALVALVIILARCARASSTANVHIAHEALAGFAFTGSVIVGLLIATGLINSWLLIGPDHAADLFKSDYGRLMAIKLLLFAGMVGLAANNRFRLTPALETEMANDETDGATSALRRSIVAETLFAALVLLVVSWLGTLAPPIAG